MRTLLALLFLTSQTFSLAHAHNDADSAGNHNEYFNSCSVCSYSGNIPICGFETPALTAPDFTESIIPAPFIGITPTGTCHHYTSRAPPRL